MSRDTDTSTSSSNYSTERKKRKTSKKSKSEKKHKKEKKTKRSKEKKRSKGDSDTSRSQNISGPIQPNPQISTELDEAAFGPVLPPHLLVPPETKAVIGPELPDDYLKKSDKPDDESKAEKTPTSDDEDFNYGPVPLGSDLNAAQIEREQRALELKIAAMEGRDFNQSNVNQTSREEWMLELPEVGLRGGLAALSNMKRTFHTGKEKPDFSDRSAWTKTPQSDSNEQKPTTSKSSGESLKQNAEVLYERARDAEQELMAKKHKRKHKRDESLVELHQKKLRKEQRKKEKELAASGAKPERRPFSRDVDLKLNKIDKNQTKQIVDKAKILDSKFYTGKTKYL